MRLPFMRDAIESAMISASVIASGWSTIGVGTEVRARRRGVCSSARSSEEEPGKMMEEL